MLLVLEIMLTLTAWRKGYKGFALIPVGLALLAGFTIGANNPGADTFSFIWVDLLAIVVLVVMIAVAKTNETEEVNETKKSGEPYPEQESQHELAASQSVPECN
jgi:hypothetical protein